MPEPDPAALERLVEDGLLQRGPQRLRTSPRWQATMARAALALQRAGAPWRDLRWPIAAALVEHYPGLGDGELATLVEAMNAIEELELTPLLGTAPAPR